MSPLDPVNPFQPALVDSQRRALDEYAVSWQFEPSSIREFRCLLRVSGRSSCGRTLLQVARISKLFDDTPDRIWDPAVLAYVQLEATTASVLLGRPDTPETLRAWCRSHGHRDVSVADIWKEFAAPRPKHGRVYL